MGWFGRLLFLCNVGARLELAVVHRHDVPISKVHHGMLTIGDLLQRIKKSTGYWTDKVRVLFAVRVCGDCLRFSVSIVECKLLV